MEAQKMTASQSQKNRKTRNHKSRKPIKKILVLEDDKDFSALLKHHFETQSDLQCVCVAEPYEALNTLSEQHFDLILIDERLPGMRGSHVIREIDDFIERDPLLTDFSSQNYKIPTILMSGGEIQWDDSLPLKNFMIRKILKKGDSNFSVDRLIQEINKSF